MAEKTRHAPYLDLANIALTSSASGERQTSGWPLRCVCDSGAHLRSSLADQDSPANNHTTIEDTVSVLTAHASFFFWETSTCSWTKVQPPLSSNEAAASPNLNPERCVARFSVVVVRIRFMENVVEVSWRLCRRFDVALFRLIFGLEINFKPVESRKKEEKQVHFFKVKVDDRRFGKTRIHDCIASVTRQAWDWWDCDQLVFFYWEQRLG